MKVEEFEELLNSRLHCIRTILGNKSEEYAHEGDRLFNFKQAATINETTPEEALWGMATKDLVSVMDLVDGRLEPTPEMVEEKIGDMINYLILLEAILKERVNAISQASISANLSDMAEISRETKEALEKARLAGMADRAQAQDKIDEALKDLSYLKYNKEK